MASILTNLLSGGIEGAGTGIAKVIDSIKGKSPEDAAKLAQIAADTQALQMKYAAEFQAGQSDLQKASIAENVSLNDIAGQNVRADATNGDKYTSRARPSVIYVGLAVILWNYCLIPVLLYKWKFTPVVLPDMVWQAWLYISLGVVFTRTADKFFGGAGGSVDLPFSTKLASKGEK
jgi:hypothetical protein